MKVRKGLMLVLLAALAGLTFVGVLIAMPTVYPLGTTIWEPSKSYNGYFLLTVGQGDPVNSQDPYVRAANEAAAKYKGKPQEPGSPGALALAKAEANTKREIWLIDMMGNVVHKWPSWGGKAILLPNGHVFQMQREIDWDGKIVWEFKPPTATHHDGRVLPDGNYLLLCYENVPAEKLKAVKDVEVPWWGLFKRSGVKLVGDKILIVTPDKKIIWEWNSSDHLDVNRFSPVNPENDWTHGNTLQAIPENKWYDAGDKRFKPGNILYNPRNFDEIMLIDRESKKVVWSWTHNLSGGLSHPHSVTMVEKGMPGEGNILVFDNGLFPRNRDHVGQSMVIELNPTNKEIVWKYETAGYSNMKFFSKTQGYMQRLPNGNTFINESNTGRLFQVRHVPGHPDGGEIVWEWLHTGALLFDQMYPYDYCPQMKNLPKPKEAQIKPPPNEQFRVPNTAQK
jgi:hypothetical protein